MKHYFLTLGRRLEQRMFTRYYIDKLVKNSYQTYKELDSSGNNFYYELPEEKILYHLQTDYPVLEGEDIWFNKLEASLIDKEMYKTKQIIQEHYQTKPNENTSEHFLQVLQQTINAF